MPGGSASHWETVPLHGARTSRSCRGNKSRRMSKHERLNKEVHRRNHGAVLVDRNRGHLDGAGGYRLGCILLFDELPRVGDDYLKCAAGALLHALLEEIEIS